MGIPERVAVIGAGPAGLGAAWTLVRAGAQVTLFEAAAKPGGLLCSAELDGLIVDPAVQLVSSTYTSLLRLVREVGAAQLLVPSPGRDAIWLRGRPHALAYGSVTSLAASSALPVGLKLKLATRYLPFLRGQAATVDLNNLVESGALAFDRESIADFGRRELGKDFIELLAYPLLAAYYGAAPEEASAGFYHGLARVALNVKVLAVAGGVGALARRIVRAFEQRGGEFRPDTRIDRVELGPVECAVMAGGQRWPFDAAVLAVPAPAVARLLALPPALQSWLEGVQVRPAITLALALDRAARVDYFGLSVPRATSLGDRVVAICVEARKAAGLVPPNRGLLLAFPAPHRLAELSDAARDEMVAALVPALEQAFPGIRSRVTQAEVYRFPQGYTLFYPGYLRHLKTYDAAWLPSRLALAGDYLMAPTVEGAVRSGIRAAGRLLGE